MSGTVCCYSGCKKSYSTDKDVSFFKFPDDPKRRKKWMQSCGNLELENLSDRQLRGKRICSDHFLQSSFLRPESRAALNDNAVPIPAKSSATTPNNNSGKKSGGAAAASPVLGRKNKVSETATSTPAPPPVSTNDEETESKSTAKRRKGADNRNSTTSTPVGAKGKNSVEVENRASPEMENLSARRLRGKRLDNSLQSSSPKPESNTSLSDAADAKKGNKKAPAVASSPVIGRKSKATIETVVSKPAASTPPDDAEDGKPAKRKKVSEKQEPSSPPISTTVTRRKKEAEKVNQEVLPERRLRGKRKDASLPNSSAKPESKDASDVTEPVAAKKSKKTSDASPVLGRKSKATIETLAKPTRSKTPPVATADTTSPTPAANKTPPVSSTEKSPSKATADKSPSKSAQADKSPTKSTVEKTPPKSPSKSASDKSPSKTTAADKTPPVSTADKPKKRKKVVDKSNVDSTPPVVKSKEPQPSTTTSPAKKVAVSMEAMMAAVSSTIAPVVSNKAATPKAAAKSTPTLQLCTQVESQPSAPPIKKLSMEAMMAAVSSTKAPVVSTKPAAPKAVPNSTSSQKSELAKQSRPKPSSGPVVEIVREKPIDGNNTVVVVRQGDGDDNDNLSEADSYDEYMYYDREFDFEHDEDIKADREFERFHISLKKYLRLPGKWTIGGVQWDPQGKRKVIIISEPEIPPNGRPCVKRCLQCFEDKSIRVFIDQMDMTDVFGMSCYSEKEDVAGLISRVADASSCCGVPEMVVDDLVFFPNVRKRNTSYFDPNCPGVIPNDAYDPICSACKDLQVLLMESREKEKNRLRERRIRSEEKQFQHPFGETLYSFFNDLADETDPSKPKKKRTKETFFRKFLHDTRYKVNGDMARTERVYIEKPISVDSVSQSFQDIVSKLGFNMPNAKKRPSGGLLPRPSPSTSSASRPSNNRVFPGGSSSLVKKLPMPVEHILPFTPGSSFTLDDGQEYELIGEVEQASEFVEMKTTPSMTQQQQQQQQFEIIEVDDETLARLASSKNQVVMLPDSNTASFVPSGLPITTRIDANDPNLSQILKAINTSHGFKVS